MASQYKAITSFVLLYIILAMAGHALADRARATKQKEDELKQAKWFIGADGSVNIPGVGRVKVPMPGFRYGSVAHHFPRSFYRRYRSSPHPRYSGNGGYSGIRYGSSTHRVPRTRRRGSRSSPDPLYTGSGSDSGIRYGSSTRHVPRTRHRGYRSSPHPRYGGNGGHLGIRFGSSTHRVPRHRHRVYRSSSPDPLYTGSGNDSGVRYGSSTRHVPRTRHRGFRSLPRPRFGGNGGFSGPSYIPGGDDTLVPNPGYEVPIPGAP